MTTDSPPRLLTRAEVAAYFQVDPRTVSRWVRTGRLTPSRTPGGHPRFSEAEVFRLAATRSGNSS